MIRQLLGELSRLTRSENSESMHRRRCGKFDRRTRGERVIEERGASFDVEIVR